LAGRFFAIAGKDKKPGKVGFFAPHPALRSGKNKGAG